MDNDLHNEAMATMDAGRLLALSGSDSEARAKYAEAALLEERCIDTTTAEQPRSRGILSVSAVTLWLWAGRQKEAEALIARCLLMPLGDGFKRELEHMRAAKVP
jgi:hypothetical protein